MNGLSSKEQPPNESYSKKKKHKQIIQTHGNIFRFPEQHSLLASFEEVARTECMKRIFNVIERMPFEKLNNIIQNSNSDDEIEIIKILERKEIITAEDRKDPIYDEIKQRIGKDWKFGVQIIEHVRICLNEVTLDQNLSPMALEVSNSSILRIISDMKHAAEIRSYGKTGQKSESIKKSLLSFIATGIPGLESPSVNTHAEGKAHKAYKKKQEERFLKSKSSFDEDSEDNSSVSSVTVLKAIQCTPKKSNRTVGDSDLLCTSAATPADGHDKGNQSPVVNPKEVYVLEMDINNAVASEESNEARTPSSNVGNLDEETQTDVFGTLAGENIIAEVSALKNLNAQSNIEFMTQDSTESRQQRTIETDTTREAAISSSSKRDESNSSHVTKPATGEGVDSKKTSATLLHGSNKSAKLMDSTKPTPRPPLETAEPRKESDTILDVANGTTLEPQDTLMNYTTESSPITTEHLASDVQDSSRIVVRPECTTDMAANTSNCLSNTSTSDVPTVPASKVCDVVGEPLTVDIDQESSKSNTATKVLRRSNRKITNTKKMSAEEIGEEDEYDHRKEISAKTRRTRNRRDRKRTSSKKKTDTATTSAPMSSSQTEQVHNSAEEEINEKDGNSRKIRYRKGTIGEKKGSNQEKNTNCRKKKYYSEFKSSTRAITTMHDSIEEPDDFGEKEKVFHQAWFRCSRRNQISTSSEVYCGISDQYKHQLFANRKFCHLHYRWDDVKAMRQRRREAGLDVENYTIQDVMRMARRSASDSPIDDDMNPYPINEN
ncbi:hypothetical protein CRE_00978 [Caenorhabditis remanei]|uniref:Uncharacterized protein n=1 Tax=Caenorhabditis remanei TaxID=31234 RepID=E3MIA8_CAERE|nr:hypothetical protein CRE_00978 [Caenorhabditis remanei]